MAYCCVEFRFATMHHWSAEIMDATSNKCNDAAFGPVVASTACRGGFDFTGEIALSILPSSLFIAAATAQCIRLWRHKSLKVRPSLLLAAKLVRQLHRPFLLAAERI
ncbi:hypothetical protein IF2G_08247 [Cordyceps javanica]|nr:hypothetical protein IF2G_08247 [Cordyceps javanica]